MYIMSEKIENQEQKQHEKLLSWHEKKLLAEQRQQQNEQNSKRDCCVLHITSNLHIISSRVNVK